MKELLSILWSSYHHLQIVDQLAPTKQSARGQHTTQFTIFPDDYKMSRNAYKAHTAISLQSSLTNTPTRFDLGQPMIYTKHPYADQLYGLFSTYGPQIPPYMQESCATSMH